jgi:cytochrome oxidase Cu insertion factor (SCO1/SenC/PrrC family)
MKRCGWALLSLTVALGSVVGYFAFLNVAAIRNRPALYVAGLAVATAIAAVASWRASRWPNLTALALSALLLVLAGYYNFVFARLPSATTTLRVGEAAPDFTLPDAAGRPVTLSSFRDRTPVVLVFYRGSW